MKINHSREDYVWQRKFGVEKKVLCSCEELLWLKDLWWLRRSVVVETNHGSKEDLLC